MKPRITQVVAVISAVVLVIVTRVEISAQASEVGPGSEPRTMLLAQAVASPEYTEPTQSFSEREHVLVGHWRKTTIVFEEPRDEHLVLMADGTAENWVVTASSHSATTKGTWNAEGKTLNLVLADGAHISQPFTIYQEQLVFPNIPKRRGFWEKIGR